MRRFVVQLLVVMLCSVPAFGADGWELGPFIRVDVANPVLSPRGTTFDDPMQKKPVAWEQDNVFNPAATVRDGEVCLLYRAEDASGNGVGGHTSRVGLAQSRDGLHFMRRPSPVLFPSEDGQKGYDWPGGCEDPRVVETDAGGYVLTYTEWNRQTARLAVATSTDLVHWVKHGPVFARAAGGRLLDHWSKSGSIVTRLVGDHLVAARVNGKYWMLWGEGTIYAATSDDLINWGPVMDAQGEPRPVLTTRPGHFDSSLVEPGPPSVITNRGIVFLYNGKGDNGAYSAGQVLLDAHDPSHVLARTDRYFLTPERPYERTGQYAAGTVFIEGLAHFHRRWWLYYGTADSHVAVATAPEELP